MKSKLIVLGTAVFVSGLIVLYAAAEEAKTPGEAQRVMEAAKDKAVEAVKQKAEEIVKEKMTAEGKPAVTELAATTEQQGMMKEQMEMMRKAGVSEEMVQSWKAMVGMPIYIDSPFAVAGQSNDLALTAEQTQKLADIQKEARQKTMDLLTAEQKTKLGKVPEKPTTMMEMCTAMHGNQGMMSAMKEKSKDMACGCPMCPMMKKQVTKPEEIKSQVIKLEEMKEMKTTE